MAVGTLVFDRVVVRERALPGPHPRRGRPQDVQAPRQHPRADPADGRSTAPTRCAGSWPPAARRGRPAGSGTRRIQEVVRKVLLTYWNTVAFQALYARTAGWSPRRPGTRRWPTGRCWTGGRSPSCTGWSPRSPTALEAFDTQRAGALLAAFVDDLSNWYVRRSRRRFWDGDPAALATLHECLVRRDAADGAAHAVHHRAGLAGRRSRPTSDGAARVGAPGGLAAGRRQRWSTTTCAAQMALARRLVELGRAARADAKVRTRQPLRRALVARPRPGPRSTEELRARGRRRAQRAARSSRCPRPAATWSTSPPRATSARSASGSASRPRGRRGDRRGRRRRARRRAAADGPRHGERRRRGRRGARPTR